MDPLSVAASLIAITQAVSTSGILLGKVLQLRQASSEYQALFNEVEALRGLLLIIKTALMRIQGSSLYDEIREPMQILLSAVQSAVVDLHGMIEYELRASEEPNKHGLPQLSKMAWLKSGGKLKTLRERIRDSRGNLVAGISALNLSTVVEVERHTAMQVQSIRLLVDRESSTSLFDHSDSGLEPTLPTLATQAVQAITLGSGQLQSGRTSNGVIAVTTTMSQQCSLFCTCSCHKRTQGQTPGWLRSVVGQLMFNYTALLQVKPCDLPSCRQDSQKSRFTYYFPQWLASKALMVAGNVNDLSGVGASWSFRFPVVVPANDRVWWIVRHGNLQALQKLFQDSVYNPYVINEYGTTLLHRAVNSGRPEAYNFLVRVGAQQGLEEGSRGNRTAQAMALSTTEYRDYALDGDAVAEELGFTALHLSIALPSSERPVTERVLKRQHESINARDRNGMTPLSWACRRGDLAATRLLLDWNADINSQDKLGRCALHHATYACDYACAAALLEAGAKVDLADVDGHTALFYLSHRGLALVDLLIKQGTNVNHQDLFGWTPTHQAAQGDDNDELVAAFLRCGADIRVQNDNGWTAIHHAVAFDCPDVLSLLIGTQSTPKTKARRTSATNIPRSLSVRSDSGNTISSMLSFATRSTGTRRSRQSSLTQVTTGPSRWTSTKDGHSVLHLAGRHAGPAVMTVLTGADLRGINPDQRSCRGSTPDDCFYQHRDEDLMVDQSPSEQAETAWEKLMSAVMQQNGLSGWMDDIEGVRDSDECNLVEQVEDLTQQHATPLSKFQSMFSELALDESAILDEEDTLNPPEKISVAHFGITGRSTTPWYLAAWSSPPPSPSLVAV
ncbi:hypothetical protein LTR56_005785 [Elasticomyces elasticus]|nr:hypothetical protein LTR56_005785 [Elasticomyces elasticus]KAK4925716.1 hypothetical protein LTR49_007326 [Elasticomyces elasticus]KAK5765048.1 hypothetical protein LTS12_004826 [Elasticomyces elasticus]